MRGFKIGLGAIVVILLSVVVMQNPDVFWDKKSLQLDLWVWRNETPEIALAVYFVTFFLVGYLGSYFLALAQRFRIKRTVTMQQQTIQRLEQEVQSMKSSSGPVQEGTVIESAKSGS